MRVVVTKVHEVPVTRSRDTLAHPHGTEAGGVARRGLQMPRPTGARWRVQLLVGLALVRSVSALSYARASLVRGGSIALSESMETPARSRDRPQLVNEGGEAPSFNDPSRRIARTVGDMTLPAQVELLRSRLPPAYAPPKPFSSSSVNTQHTLEVVVGALLALTDGRLEDMQAAADTEGVERLHRGVESAMALRNPEDQSASGT